MTKASEFEYVVLVDTEGNPYKVTSGSGGTSMTDDAAFTPGASSVTPAGFLADDAGTDALDEGDIGAARLNPTTRILYVQLKDNSGSDVAVGGGTQYTEGDTDASITGTALLFEGAADTLVVAPGTAANGLDVDVTRVSGTVTVDGSGVTQPVSGTVSINSIPAGTNNIGDVDVLSLPALPAGTNNIGDVDVLTVPADPFGANADAAATAGSTGSMQAKLRLMTSQLDAIKTAVETLDNAIAGSEMQVDVLTLPAITGTVTANAGTNLNTSALLTTAAHDAAFGTAGAADSQVRSIQGVASMTPVQVGDNSASLSVDWNGTQPVTGSGNATGALRVELPTNGTGIVGLAAGTNAIGKLAANSGVDIGDVTLTAGTAAIGSLLPPDIDVTAHTNYARKYYTSTGAATDGIIWSPAAGKRWHVTSLFFQVSADATVTFEDDKSGGDDPVLKGEFKAGSGLALSFDEKYPFASGEDAADLIVTTSAGNIYVSVVGYEI